MSLLLEITDMRGGYIEVGEAILRHGTAVAPRGQATREIYDATIVLHDPTDCLPVGIGRRLNTNIAFLEAAQLIGGAGAPPAMIERIAPQMASFAAESDGTYWGAYGQRIGDQMLHVERKLQDDPDSRQATVTLWDPVLDNIVGKRDYPCTNMLNFMIRDDTLLMYTTMRSNDFFLGLAFDVAQFTQLQLTLAAALGVKAGTYHHHAVSLHIYERDLDAIAELTPPDPLYPGTRLSSGIGRPGDSMDIRMLRARDLLNHRPLLDATPIEELYAHALA